MTSETIKSCPFCGGEAYLADKHDCEECIVFDTCEWHDEHGTCEGCDRHDCWCCVVCDFNKGGCGAAGGWRDNPDAAVAAWNTRAERTCHVVSSYFYDDYDIYEYQLSCGHEITMHESEPPNHCPICGAKITEVDK